MTAAFSNGEHPAIVLDGYDTRRWMSGGIDVICETCWRGMGWDFKAVSRGEHLVWASEHSEKHADVLVGVR